MTADSYKRAAAARAIDFVRSGMRLGLGTGSTAQHFVELLAERVRAGLDVIAVPTSEATRAQAERSGVALATLDDVPELDLTVDGADEIGPDLTLIRRGRDASGGRGRRGACGQRRTGPVTAGSQRPRFCHGWRALAP